jgi:FemAB-related protein (PEP-CTERM system-associated)
MTPQLLLGERQRARPALTVAVHEADSIAAHLPRWEQWLCGRGQFPLSRHPGWLLPLWHGLQHTPFCVEATQDGCVRGLLPLAFVHSLLFGRFLVSLPYLNYGGPIAEDEETARRLIDRAVDLAAELRVRHLELREEQPTDHVALGRQLRIKVHMRRTLPSSTEGLWHSLDGKVRNQIRKGRKNNLSVCWGGPELLDEFHAVFSRNMRDLGTPSYGRDFFRAIFRQFPGRVEFCVVRGCGEPIAAAYLAHGWGVTEVPTASSLREFNSTCANMLMYWHLLERAVERGQQVFDFGRSTLGGSTYRFKRQWGAEPGEAVWQYHVRHGDPSHARPESPRNRWLSRCWSSLPVGLTRLLGPIIVRGVP